MTATRLIRRLAAVTVRVPDPARTAAHLEETLDFEPRPGADGAVHVTAEGDYGLGAPPRLLTIAPGGELAVDEVTFEAGGEDALEAIEQRVASQGLHPERFEADATGESGMAFADPDGIRVKCRLPVGASGAPLRSSDVRPRRLGHVNLKVPAPPRSAAFYGEALGLKLTEQLGDMLFFLRVGSDHHNLAFRPTPGAPNVHHVAFEVPGWESFRVICDHMATRGHQIEFGPGRHAPGHQLFMYLTDPTSGLRLEVFADMAHIDDDETYTPIRRDVDRRRSLNVWGPAAPPTFLE